jgi:hypothetical protein
MKMIYTAENMMNQEFQHFVEEQLIEVMILKMQMIQFVSISKRIQMKLIYIVRIESE